MPRRRRTVSSPAVRAAAVATLATAAAVALGACGNGTGSNADVVAGKQQFVGKCGACHTLARADTKGTVGPNLDQAFQQALHDGMGRDGIAGAVREQILHPRAGSQMPAGLAKGQDASNIAEYVGTSVAKPGTDAGLLGSAVKKAGGGAPAVAKAGTLQIDTDPNGQLAYVTSSALAKPGKITVQSKNPSGTPHDIVIDGKGKGAVVSNGGVSKFTASFSAGKYTFYCSVPGHRQAGMQGTLTVK
jgi:uncharacterized cupredoxin-like copper-binding protein